MVAKLGKRSFLMIMDKIRLLILLFIFFSISSFGRQITFCVDDPDASKNPQEYALDADVFQFTNNGMNCFNHTTVGQSIILFTNGFNIDYDKTHCGYQQPCIIQLQINSKKLISIYIAAKNLFPRYK